MSVLKCNPMPCKCHSSHYFEIEEIDFVDLIIKLWSKRKLILLAIFSGAILTWGAGRLRQPEWNSEARIIPPLFRELQGQQSLKEKLIALDVSVPLNSDTWFILFIQAYDSTLLQQAWLKQSQYANQQLHFSRQSSVGDKRRAFNGYRYETLTLTGRGSCNTKEALADYMRYISSEVNKDMLLQVQQTIRQKLVGKEGNGKMPVAQLSQTYVQPYRIEEAPTDAFLISKSVYVLMLLSGVLSGLMACGYVIAMPMFRKRIQYYRAIEK